MTNLSDEQISALVDGELDAREHQASVDKLLAHREHGKAWGRYHLIGDTLKRSLPKGMDHDFSSRVMAALDNEPTVLAPPATKTSWGQRVAGLAVAASVTAVAILGVQFMYQQDGAPPLTPQIAQVPTELLPVVESQQVARTSIQQSRIQQSLRANIQTVTQSSVTMAHSPKPVQQIHPRLNKYLVDHNQQAPRAAVQGMIPYARIVAYPNSHRLLIQAQK